jgi:hypothetical protein
MLTILARRSVQQMTLSEAQSLALRVLKQVMEEKLDHHNVQLAQVGNFIFDFLRVRGSLFTALSNDSLR